MDIVLSVKHILQLVSYYKKKPLPPHTQNVTSNVMMYALFPLPSNRQHLRNNDCLEDNEGKISALFYAVLCTMVVHSILIHIQAVLKAVCPLFPSNRYHQSNGDCLEGKRDNYQVCSMQYCVQQLCTVQCTHICMNRPNSSLEIVLSHWAHFTVLRSFSVCIIFCITVYCMHV